MTQRNAMNDRSQNGPTGHTRKSASSAKPITKAASSVYVVDTKAKPKKGFLSNFFSVDKNKDQDNNAKTKNSTKAQTSNTSNASSSNTKAIQPQPKQKLTRAEKRAQRDAEKQAEYAYQDALRKFKPRTRGYLKWRRVWAGLLIAGVILALIMLAMNYIFAEPTIMMVSGIAAWGCLMIAIFVDIKKVRPAKERAFLQSGKSKKRKK